MADAPVAMMTVSASISTPSSKAPYVITFEEGVEVEADTVIIATGASAKYLGLPDEEKYAGMGVSAFVARPERISVPKRRA